MAVVEFDVARFRARYPEFTSADPDALKECFAEAGFYLSNADSSPVQNVERRAVLLNMLTAHIATLGGMLASDGKPIPVGRVSQAAQGSVSASFEFTPPTPGSGPWFNQTQYGAAFWQATASLRGFRYRARPTVIT